GRVGFDGHPDAASDTTSRDVVSDVATDAPGYHATAVRFATAANDFMFAGNLANTTDSPRGTYSVWLRFHGGDGQLQLLSVAQVVGIGGVVRTAANQFELLMQNCLAVPLLDMRTTGTYTTDSGWVHLLASWDVAANRAQLYVGDAVDQQPNPGIVPGNICYASLRWGIGGLSSGQLDADVAELYADLGTSLDLTIDANRRAFSDSAGKPVDLGPQCSAPTGHAPTGCFTGDVATWFTNKGKGAGFTPGGGALAEAPTSPSD
ncbi:MAG TPA: hypothetical protein VFQ65_21170, partial [Kofleriaceae bacterium]|nr:hypothetical protein [Kofleriaceae bacterium]